MEVRDLLSKLRAAQIDISLDGENLKLLSDHAELPGQLLVELRQHKAQLIQYLKKQTTASSSDVFIPLIPSAVDYPCSSAQQRMWLLSQFEEANVAYNVADVLTFSGELSVAHLQAALADLIERHEVFRTVFLTDVSGMPRQSILPMESFGFQLQMEDLTTHPQPAQELESLIRLHKDRPFDLAKGPLIRALLVQVGENRSVFCFVTHHIISDGWSMLVLKKELLSFYNARQQKTTAGLTPLRIQYKEYCHWLAQRLGESDQGQHQAYWQEVFQGELPVLALREDFRRPRVKTYRGAVLGVAIESKKGQAFRALCKKQGVSLFTGLTALVKTLLFRHTQQTDIILGTVVAGREYPELENQIGLYVNTLALRTKFEPQDNFLQLLEKVRDVILQAYEHQLYPFDEIVGQLDLPRDTSREPIFDCMVKLENKGMSTDQLDQSGLGELDVQRYAGPMERVSKYDITFDFFEQEQGIELELEYNSDLFLPETIERLNAHLQQLLGAVTEQPQQPISHLELLTTQQQNQLIHGFNPNANIEYPRDVTTIQLFEEKARQQGDAIAIRTDDICLTYSQLDDLAGKLAAHLTASHNISTDDLIGICLERSEWLLVAILAIWKAGGGYLPLDPHHPDERNDYIKKDSGLQLLIDDGFIQDFQAVQQSLKPMNAPGEQSSDALAYVLYTSGSTGRPKGVMIEHQSLVLFVQNIPERLSMKELTSFAAITNATFDISILELMATLVNGISVRLFAKDDPHQWMEAIERAEIDSLQLTPSRLEQLIQLEPRAMTFLDKLKVLLVGGEAMTTAQFLLLRTLSSCEVFNVYGPTETVIWSSAAKLNDAKELTIGQPLLGESIYILSPDHQLTPIGAAGEILIGGDSLARGYCNKSELTQQKFISHPFDPEKKLYRTGDLGAWSADGSLLFLGRLDDQVKWRGYRIELGEIEFVIQQHESIERAVVLLTQGDGTEKDMLCFVEASAEIGTEQLKNFLRKKLPLYMIPSSILQVEKIPMNSSGKVDRKALLSQQHKDLQEDTAYAAPTNDIQETIIDALSKLTKRKRAIGIDEGFFSLGINSLRMVHLLNTINASLNASLRLVDLFEHPNTRALSEQILSLQSTTYEEEMELDEQEEDLLESVDDLIDSMDELIYE
ncbi:MAG: amino acid adenylation domain-containing protein [Bacteroidota bacterium]